MLERSHPIASCATAWRIALVAAAGLLAWALSNVILLAFLAVLFAAVLRGAADWLSLRTRMPPNAMLALIVISLALSTTGLAYWIGPRLAQQGQDVASTLAQQFHVIRQNLEATLWGRPLARSLTSFDVKAAGVLAPAETAARLTVSMLAGLVVLLVTTFYMAISPNLYVEGVLGLLPIPHRPRAREIMTRVTHVLRFWFLGQLVDMFTIGALAAAGLYLLHVPAPYALGVLTGLLTFIPYFGAVLAAIPAIMLALTVGWSTALWALVVYFACHIVEGYVVAPQFEWVA